MALFLLLLAFPAISWYYLQTGLDYRLETLNDLGDHGKIPDFELVTYQLDTLDREFIDRRMVVAGFFDLENETLSTAFGENLRKLHHQFDSRDDLIFLHHILGGMQEAKKINAFERKYELTDETQSFFLVKGRPAIEQLAREGYKLPLGEGVALDDNPYLVLADTTGTVRRYYDVRKNEEVKRLVEHIAILLPQQKERDLVFKREREK